MTRLNNGDLFPSLTIDLLDADPLQIPRDLSGHYGVVLFFRGAWCPYCNAQLRAFQRAHAKLRDVGARIVALSTEDKATTRALVAEHGLEFDLGHDADAHAIHKATGAYVNESVPNI